MQYVADLANQLNEDIVHTMQVLAQQGRVQIQPLPKANCIFKYVDGQKRGKFEDKVWTADSAKEHVSERKFVDENALEEFIVPATSDVGMSQASSATAELVT
jgi:nuclear polyadenylated RNA-binding protein NAB2